MDKKLSFACTPTPIQFLQNLTQKLNGPQIFIKRDDLTGFAFGGNKLRKLEYLMVDVLKEKATDLITCGAVQSNHCLQTAAIAAKYGLGCHLLLENRCGNVTLDYLTSGNLFGAKFFEAKVHFFDGGTDMVAAMKSFADTLRSDGRRPSIIPGGGSTATGSLGYVSCATEIVQQMPEVDEVIIPTGSGGTQAGLIVGFARSQTQIRVLGIGTNAQRDKQKAKVSSLCAEIQRLLPSGEGEERRALNIDVNCDYIGEGYGCVSARTREAIKMVARLEGIFLDPVYTGVSMGALIDLIRKGHYRKDEKVLFIHTGGSSALFAYKNIILSHL